MATHNSLDTALAFADWGFRVVSVWGIKDGVCMCPKGAACDNKPGKHPIPRNGLTAATTDRDAITKMLSAPGSAGNYGIIPPPNVVAIDVDSEGWREKLRDLHLPRTMAVESKNGVHLFFHWPAEYGPQPTQLHGWLVRSQDHPGYTLGPGSTHQSGWVYRIAHQNGHDTHTMLARIATFPRPDPAGSETVITTTGPVDPRTVEQGGRHHHLVKTARYLFGIGLTGEALFAAVWQVNLLFPQPKTEAEVRRAIGDVETKFLPDADPEVIDLEGLFVKQTQYHATNASTPTYVSPLVAYGTVSLISGPPKGGKSTLISNLLAARQAGLPFLWGDPVPTGPMALVTEEGGFPVVRKTAGLTTLDILDRMAFVVAGLRTLDHLLVALSRWAQAQDGPALVVIDTLAVWGDIKDENDAVAATRAIIALRVWAQQHGAAVVLVHHTRKGGGEHGEAIRGSGGIFAAVDTSVELAFDANPYSDDRKVTLAGRLDYGTAKVLEFDRATMTYSLSARVVQGEKWPTAQFPMQGTGVAGLTKDDAATIWDCTPGAAGNHLRELVASGALVAVDVRPDGSRTSHKEYLRAAPILSLDTRSTGERMADIFASRDDVDGA